MAKFFCSDTHFGHRNVIKYCNRPWETVAEMDEAIIEQWNSQVKPGDTVYHLGDVGIGKGMSLKKDIIQRLNGNKNLVLGNHDACFNTLHKNPDCVETYAKVAKKYLDAGWCSVDIIKYLMLEDGTHVVMTHLPPDNSYDNRYSQYKVANNPNFNYLHGHLHAHYLKKDNMVDLSFDGNLKLYPEEEVIALVNDKREFIPSRITDYYNKTNPIMLKPFEEERKRGNISRKDNFNGDLCLYNYTEQCTFDRAWNDVTKSSRGIVFEASTGKVVAFPFPKFWNYSELMGTSDEKCGMLETKKELIRCLKENESYSCFEKMDGSLGIIYFYKDKWRVNTRGSFESEQAVKALEILKKYNMNSLYEGITLLTEIIYPENKIVVNYGQEEKLVLLGAYWTNEQEEVEYDELLNLGKFIGMPVVKKYHYTIEEMLSLQKTLPKDSEGFVVRFQSGLRIKIKGDEYFRIHKMISRMTPIAFWEFMKDGKVNVDYLQELPEEYRNDADMLINLLESEYTKINKEIDASLDNILRKLGLGNINEQEYRKKVGLFLKHNKVPHQACIFSKLLNKDDAIDRYIMKNIRPTNNKIKEK